MSEAIICESRHLSYEIRRRDDGSVYVTFRREDGAYPSVELAELERIVRRAKRLSEEDDE